LSRNACAACTAMTRCDAVYTGCVYNVTGSGGNIKSPNYPNKYLTNRTCDWNIYSRHPRGTIMLIIHEFKMEGNPQGRLYIYTLYSTTMSCHSPVDTDEVVGGGVTDDNSSTCRPANGGSDHVMMSVSRVFTPPHGPSQAG